MAEYKTPALSGPIELKGRGDEQKPPEASVANDLEERRRRRIPFSTAVRKLEAQPVSGYHTHFFLERNVMRAMDAGYEFVKKAEVNLNNLSAFAADIEHFKGTDLGDRVSLIGDLTSNALGGPERCYLMKIRQEWRDDDTKALEEVALRPIKAIFHDELVARPGTPVDPADPTKGGGGGIGEKGPGVYVKQALFNRPARKAKIGRQS